MSKSKKDANKVAEVEIVNPKALLNALIKILNKKSNRKILEQGYKEATILDSNNTNTEDLLVSQQVKFATKKDLIYMTLTAKEVSEKLFFERPSYHKGLSVIRVGRALTNQSKLEKSILNGVAHYKIKEIKA